jgi:hypothetical protein
MLIFEGMHIKYEAKCGIQVPTPFIYYLAENRFRLHHKGQPVNTV